MLRRILKGAILFKDDAVGWLGPKLPLRVKKIIKSAMFLMGDASRWAKRLVVQLSVKHVYGPRKIGCKKNEAIVLCYVKNGECWIKDFIEHYLAMGFKHIVFLDNCSSDRTIPLAKKYSNVTVIQSRLSHKRFQYSFRQYLLKRFSRGKWGLYADIDEFFDYPFSDKISLSKLLEYLGRNGYTAAAAHMLDMFSGKPLLSNKPGRNMRRNNRHYDISAVEKRRVFFEGFTIKAYFGGVQKNVFGLPGIWLTKFPLIFNKGKIKPYITSHLCRNLNPADVTGVLFHYRYLCSFPSKAYYIAKKGHYWNKSENYKKFVKVLKKNPNINIRKETLGTSKYLKNTNQLVDDGFIKVSKKYMDWVKNAKGN